MKIYSPQKNNAGFTLIEILVSSTIFVIIVTLAISSLLLMNRSFKVSQYKKEQFDTLNAVMEDMVRNIRVGTQIRCDEGLQYDDSIIETPEDCTNEVGDDMQASYIIAFEGVDGDAGDPSDQIVYSFTQDGNGVWGLYKSTTGYQNGTFVRLTPESISLTDSNIGFSVLHSADTGDGIQPFVTIRLSGTIVYQNDPTTFNLQTSVTPRTPEF
jgi:prepilin-type N-terminal cleavage/methylation domain-containing protein